MNATGQGRKRPALTMESLLLCWFQVLQHNLC